MKKRLLSILIGLAIIVTGFLILDGLGYVWGLVLTHFDPAHPEKFGHGINFLRGFCCTAMFIMVFGGGGFLAYTLGKGAVESYEDWKESR